MSRAELWLQNRWLWAPALLFFVLNLGLLSAYRLVYAGRTQVLEDRLSRATAELAELEERRAVRQELLDRATRNRERVEELLRSRLAAERERLTGVISEVKGLARRVGLEPGSLSYPEERLEDYGLVKRSLVFGVEGTYMQVRQLINMLELSESFLTLEEVALSEAGGDSPRLRMSLRISSLFVDDRQAQAGVRAEAGS